MTRELTPEQIKNASAALAESAEHSEALQEDIMDIVRSYVGDKGVLPVIVAASMAELLAHMIAVLTQQRAEFEERAPTENDARELLKSLLDNLVYPSLGTRVQRVDAEIQRLKTAAAEAA
jgi:hypothetical protein